MSGIELREKYERFKQWQEQPYDYTYSPDKEVHCNNCGHDYRGQLLSRVFTKGRHGPHRLA